MNETTPGRFEPACRPPWTLTYGKEENCESWKWAEIHDADGNLVYETPKDHTSGTWITPDDLQAIVTAVNAVHELKQKLVPPTIPKEQSHEPHEAQADSDS